MFRNRIRDHFTQNWYAFICNASKLEYYSQFKTEFKLEKYVESISNDMLRSELAALRLSAHNLEIKRGATSMFHVRTGSAVSARWEWSSQSTISY